MTAEITIVTAKAPGGGLWAFVRGAFAWAVFGAFVGSAWALVTTPRHAPEPRACEASQFGCADLELLDYLPIPPQLARNLLARNLRNPAMNICPCNQARWGAALLAWCIYAVQFPHVFFGERSFDTVVQKIEDGDVFNAKGLLVLALSLAAYWVGQGIREAFDHDDDIDWRSVLWSGGAVALALYGLGHAWVFSNSALMFHGCRALWFGWAASNGTNLVLQFRGLIGQWQAQRPPRATYVEPAQPPGFLQWRRWVRRTEWQDGERRFTETETWEENGSQADVPAFNNDLLPQGGGGFMEFMARVQEFHNDLPALPDASGHWPEIPHARQPQSLPSSKQNKVVPLLPPRR